MASKSSTDTPATFMEFHDTVEVSAPRPPSSRSEFVFFRDLTNKSQSECNLARVYGLPAIVERFDVTRVQLEWTHWSGDAMLIDALKRQGTLVISIDGKQVAPIALAALFNGVAAPLVAQMRTNSEMRGTLLFETGGLWSKPEVVDAAVEETHQETTLWSRLPRVSAFLEKHLDLHRHGKTTRKYNTTRPAKGSFLFKLSLIGTGTRFNGA